MNARRIESLVVLMTGLCLLFILGAPAVLAKSKNSNIRELWCHSSDKDLRAYSAVLRFNTDGTAELYVKDQAYDRELRLAPTQADIVVPFDLMLEKGNLRIRLDVGDNWGGRYVYIEAQDTGKAPTPNGRDLANYEGHLWTDFNPSREDGQISRLFPKADIAVECVTAD